MSTNKTNNYSDDFKLKPEDITKNYKFLSQYDIVMALTTPNLAPAVLSVIAKFNDTQLKAAIPIMSLEQIKLTIPKLQLQQTGVAVQVMSPPQVRQAIESLTADDRNILMQNISLLSSSSNKDEMQSFISFIDPLAIAIAVQMQQLSKRILEAAGVMTVEQIKVVVPLLSCEQIRDLMLALDHDTQIEAAISMIDRKDELIKVIQEDFVTLETQHSSILPKLSTLKDEIPELEKNISGLSSCDDPEAEYELIVRKLRNTKTSIEGLQQSVREIQSFLKLPFKILNEKEHSELRDKYTKLLNVTTENAKELHKLFSLLTSDQDGLTLLLQKQWQQIKSSLGGAASRTHDKREEKSNPEAASTESVFENDDLALVLYEAVKAIGNPNAVGNHYPMTWNDIIVAGFRSPKDFSDKGITNLEELQKFLNKTKAAS